LEFRLLGPLEVVDGDRSVVLGGAKQRALLAALLLRPNEVVSTDRLIDEVWGGDAPPTAAKVLHVYVSQLRKALDPEGGRRVIVTRPPGYTIQLAAGELDVQRFERLHREGRAALENGRPEDAARLLGEALALWRGPALGDLVYEPFAQAAIARLEELRVVALEERIEADLARGRDAELVAELETLVGQHPLRERLRGQLMLALYRSGRQAEALEAYQRARAVLVDELGIEPGLPLRELEKAILRQDPALAAAAVARVPVEAEPAEAVAPRFTTPFVGRDGELGELVAGLEDALSGRGRLFRLVGDPGIGKSRLAEELAARATARRARVLVGRCWEAGGAPAYWPWLQALRNYVREIDAEELRAQLGQRASDLAQMLPELHELLPGLPPPVSPESEAARFRLFDAAAGFLRKAAAKRPLVLVLDDLHAADAPSLLLLQFVTRALCSARVLILGAYRDVGPIPGEPLTAMLAEVAREPVTRRLSPGGLSQEDVATYVEATASEIASPELVAALYEETEGNPLFVGEIVRLLSFEGVPPASGAEVRLAIPQDVRDVIARRLTHLSDECNRLLVLAAVLGREFDLQALARASEYSADSVLELLDEAIGQRVVADVPASPGRLRFAHALIRDTLYDGLGASRRLRLHRQIGEVLEALYARDPEPHLAELAHHFVAAAPSAGVDKAIDYAGRAGDRAASLLAYEEAVRLYEMALPLIDDDVARCELLLALGDARGRAGDAPASQQAYRKAAELADAQRLPEHLARAALGYGGRFSFEVSRDVEYRRSLLEAALVTLGEGDSPLRVRLLARLASGPLRKAGFQQERMEALSSEALAMARRIGDPATLAYALIGYVNVRRSPDFSRERLELAGEAVRTAIEAGDKERAVEAHEVRLAASIELGAPPGADRARGDGEARGGAPATVAGLVRGCVQSAPCAVRRRSRPGRGSDRRRSERRRAGTELVRGPLVPVPAVCPSLRARTASGSGRVRQAVRRGVRDVPHLALHAGAYGCRAWA
jgi:DNA-binding SARP family transcriptional activator